MSGVKQIPSSRILFQIVLLSLLVGSATGSHSFGDTSGTLPNMTEISIYNVTDLSTSSDKETKGDLITSGRNQTFRINQSQSQRQYRFSFRIQNDGNSDWDVATGDSFYHQGLNSSWTVDKIWYNISGDKDYDGGDSSGNTVNWTNTTGTLGSTEVMYAKYLVTVDTSSSELRSQEFLVNDTSNSSGSQDYHNLNLTKLGYLDLTLEDPPDSTTLAQNRTFLVNGTVECFEGECGDVDASARYNQSSSADSLIPENSGTPFHTNNSNTKTCGNNLLKGESCSINWDVNATGNLESYHLLDFNATSSYNKILNNESGDNQVQINLVVSIDTSWSRVEYGFLDPGVENKSALGNQDLSYNITVSDSGNSVDDLWIKSENLTSVDQPSAYSISSRNLSYSFQNDTSTENFLSNSYSRAKTDISPGTVLNSFFWIDVPTGILNGEYNGSINIKANSTA